MATFPPHNNHKNRSRTPTFAALDGGEERIRTDESPDAFVRQLTPNEFLSVEHRQIRRQIVEVCFATGVTIDRDVLTIILATKAGRDEAFGLWTPTTVRELLWVDIVEWCLMHEVDVPGDVPETLWAMLGCLALPDDEIAALREPLTLEAGLDRNGRRKPNKRRHPSRKRVS